MAINNASLAGSGFRLQQMISLEVNRLLADTSNLRNSPFLQYAGSVNSIGSDTIRIRKYSLGGRDLFKAAGTEYDDEVAGAIDPTVSYADIQVARQYLIRQISDLGTLAGYGSQDLNPFVLATDMVNSYEARFADLTADCASLLSTNVIGSSAVTMSVDLFFSAIKSLQEADTNRGVDATDLCMVLHPKALGSLQTSLRSESNNAVSLMQATQDMLEIKGRGYAGKLFGIDVYKSSFVNEATSAHENFMLAPQCIGYADGVPSQLPDADAMNMGKIMVEFQRQATQALSQIVGHCYIGFGVIDQYRGCLIKTDSTP